MEKAKIERYLNNLSVDALKQICRFLLDVQSDAELRGNREEVLKCIKEFSKMYMIPEAEEYEE